MLLRFPLQGGDVASICYQTRVLRGRLRWRPVREMAKKDFERLRGALVTLESHVIAPAVQVAPIKKVYHLIVIHLASSLPAPFAIGLTLALMVVLSMIAVVDLRHFRIPDCLSLPLIAAGLILAVTIPVVDAAHHLIGAGVGFLLLAGIGEVYFRRRGVEGLGLGDAKLFAAAGAWLGWSSLPLVLLIAASGGLVQVLLRGKFDRRTAIAFGPWLAAAFWIVWVVGLSN